MDKQGLWRGDSDFEISEINYKGNLKKQVQKWEWGSANIQLLNGDMIRIPTTPSSGPGIRSQTPLCCTSLIPSCSQKR
jgi:hypothetical protein